MRDDLLLYYERELSVLRQLGAQFAEKYPKIASRLVLEPDKCEDPHVERLLEAFAFLAARVHLKIDDEFPEITEALLSIVYPHYIRPLPSMSIAEFALDPEQGKVVTGMPIPRGSVLYSRPVAGTPCKFRTCYDTTLWPVSIAEAEWRTPERLAIPLKGVEAAAALRLVLQCPLDLTLDKLRMDTLRFYLSGESGLVSTLYEVLANNCIRILVRDPAPNTRLRPVVLPADALRPVGFADDEGMLPYPRRSLAGYRLLQEYFAFPEKYLFFDLSGLAAAWGAGFKQRAELVFLFSAFEGATRRETLELGVSAGTFRLGCTPIVNLFHQTAEPILLDQRRYEYPVIPDVRRPNATEVFSVDEVLTIDPQTRETVGFEPFYSFRHATARDKAQTFWLANRRRSTRRGDEGTEVHLSLVDLSMRPIRPEADTLAVRVTCTNRDLPSRLPFGNESGDFELEGGSSIKRILALRKPTATLRPPVGKGTLWRLISHLSLNYLSLVEQGKEALQEILKLYEFTSSSFAEKQIEGITAVSSRRQFARVTGEEGIAFARGMRVEIEFDEEQFVGGGVYLFASVLEQFLGSYVSLNSFSQMVARTRQRKEVLREWRPRAGRRILM